MVGSSVWPERQAGPSAWRNRLPGVVLALVGCSIATYLGLFQMGLLADVWEPFFGSGSRFVLKESSVARALPVPDAALGALVYLAEAVAECAGGRRRWRTWPAAVFTTGALAAALAVAAVGLVGCQVFWLRAYCTLCLASAACSLLIAGIVLPEVRAAWRHRADTPDNASAHGDAGQRWSMEGGDGHGSFGQA